MSFITECVHMHARMSSEDSRLQTFQRWPTSAPISPVELARSGFFYLGPGDGVQCFACGGVLKNWARGENPMGEHRRFFPLCPFVRGAGGRHQRADCPDGQILGQLQMAAEDAPILGNAAHPDMELEWTRLSTFHNWPQYMNAQPQELARAGFFYTGRGDHVKCYYCDGGLTNWEHDDHPWTEHAKWFPRCEFLLQTLGPDFVRHVQEQCFGSLDNVGIEAQQTERSPAPHHELEARSLETEPKPSPASDAVTAGTAEEQLRRLQEEHLCKICMDNQVSIVFIPCGHLVCADCAPTLTLCPICRARILSSVRTFMS